MAVSKKEQDARDNKAREMRTSKLYMQLTFNDKKKGAEAGIDFGHFQEDEFVSSIFLAQKASGKPFEELADLGLGELNRIVFGDLLAPEIKELLS